MPWDEIRRRLDLLPVWAVEDGAGACTVHVDLESAQSAGKAYPTGLGTTYERAFGVAGEGRATTLGTVKLVPSAADVALARNLPGGDEVDWDAGAIPLFGSYSMRRRLEGGQQVTPLFLSGEDAKQAIDDATPPGGEPPVLRSLSLQSMVEDMAAGRNKNPASMHIIAPSASVRFTRSLQEALPAESSVREDLASIFDGTMDSTRSGGIVFPE